MRGLLLDLNRRIEAAVVGPAQLSAAAQNLLAMSGAEVINNSDVAYRLAIAPTLDSNDLFQSGIRGCAIETRLRAVLAIIPGGRVASLLDFPILLEATARCPLRIQELSGMGSFDREEFKRILIELALNLP